MSSMTSSGCLPAGAESLGSCYAGAAALCRVNLSGRLRCHLRCSRSNRWVVKVSGRHLCLVHATQPVGLRCLGQARVVKKKIFTRHSLLPPEPWREPEDWFWREMRKSLTLSTDEKKKEKSRQTLVNIMEHRPRGGPFDPPGWRWRWRWSWKLDGTFLQRDCATLSRTWLKCRDREK
jgi:hypothetical protein